MVESIASEGDEVGEGVGRHRNDEEERELYLCVLLQKWRQPQVNGAGWAVFYKESYGQKRFGLCY